MSEIDLWDDDVLNELLVTNEEEDEEALALIPQPKHVLSKGVVEVQIRQGQLHLFTRHSLTHKDFENCLGMVHNKTPEFNHYQMRLNPVNSFVLRNALSPYKIIVQKIDAILLGQEADKIALPTANLTDDSKHVEVHVPGLKTYRELLSKVNAYPSSTGFRVNLSKVLDLEAFSENMDSFLPKISFDKKVLELNREAIVGFDGTLDSLKELPTSSLNVVSVNTQSWKALKSSKETLEEKMTSMGITNLYDLLFFLPRRYIDKSNPQDLKNLIQGETAVVVGKIKSTKEINSGRGGAAFFIELDNNEEVRATFFNQAWLLSKFKTGQEVLVTGKFSWWEGKPQITGSSIEHAEEAANLPIVPVYKQMPSKGITTYFIMSANRELLSRLGDVELPTYFKKHGRMDYCDALKELHFPTSLAKHYEAVNDLAYYELVYMQLQIQEAKEESLSHQGITMAEDSRKLQPKAIKTLPFNLTQSQKKAVVVMNKKMASSSPSSTLLNSDVGTGKTLCAQLSCLKAVDSGYQACLIAPTDILSTQLYNSFAKLAENLEKQYGEKIEIEFISSSVKLSERKKRLKRIADGEVDIVIGSHSVASSVKYKNLGLVVFDEQQKFAAELRSALLSSREDGRVPDTLMMSATPVPRTTAQAIYGDIDIIQLTEKPAGRLPIETQWLEEDPQEILEVLNNDLWNDVIEEAGKGNQTFIITPLVSESDKIDSASAEYAYNTLTKLALSGLNVGLVHGRMKKDEQNEQMDKLKNKEYDVMIASTVVEVGVDIPDATRVIILSAERLGSASLHQIRGRVGRNSKPSKCYLVSLGNTENSRIRLQSLVDNENGLDIAQADLALRGEGKIFGIEQSGRSDMIFANLAKHSDQIEKAKEEALRILKSPFRDKALKDSKEKFESNERLI